MKKLIINYESQANDILSSFRRDYALELKNNKLVQMVEKLKKQSDEFLNLWKKHDVYASCNGIRYLNVMPLGIIPFEHTSLIVNQERHLKLAYYKPLKDREPFNRLVMDYSRNFKTSQ